MVPQRALLAILIVGMIAAVIAAMGTRHNPAPGPHPIPILVHREFTCQCCQKWIRYLEANGFVVEDRVVNYLEPIQKLYGVPEPLRACHTAIASGYVIEGHVSAEDIKRLLVEKPSARGLAVPGMPGSSPGMEEYSLRHLPYDVLLFEPNGTAKIYAHHGGPTPAPNADPMQPTDE